LRNILQRDYLGNLDMWENNVKVDVMGIVYGVVKEAEMSKERVK
jgi:hypothetical protein